MLDQSSTDSPNRTKEGTMNSNEIEASNQTMLTFVYNGQNRNKIPVNVSHLVFLASVDLIGPNLYNYCFLEQLVTVTLLYGIVEIGPYAFANCKSLREISIPMTVVRILNNAFQSCESLVNVELHEGLRAIGDTAFAGCKSLSRVSVPSTTKAIVNRTFAFCECLVELELQEGLRSIADEAFLNCVSLCGVSIPSTTETIGKNVFAGCVSLLGVEFSNNPSLKSIYTSCFHACPALVNIFNPTLPGNFFAEGSPSPNMHFRYYFLPIHKCCYYASSSTSSDLEHLFEALSEDWKNQKDTKLFTPFHVIATAAKPRLDLLKVLLENYSLHALSEKDMYNKTMLDYLLRNSTPRAIPLIKLVLQKLIIDQMSEFGMERWAGEVFSLVESMDWNGDLEVRRQCLDRVLARLSLYAKKEAIALLELALWKKSAMPFEKEIFFVPRSSKRRKVDRNASRVTNRASVVTPSVIDFLWGKSAPAPVDLSMMPHVSWMLDKDDLRNL